MSLHVDVFLYGLFELCEAIPENLFYCSVQHVYYKTLVLLVPHKENNSLSSGSTVMKIIEQ